MTVRKRQALYLVHIGSGSYDDYVTWVDTIWSSEKLAQSRIEKIKLQEHLNEDRISCWISLKRLNTI